MDKLLEIMNAIGIPFAYDHFAEGESPAHPFIYYLLSGSDNFAADGRVYYKNKVKFNICNVHYDEYKGYREIATKEDMDAF